MEMLDNDKLITAMQMQPALWDKTHADYAVKTKKEKAWRGVMAFVYGENVLECEKQKKNMHARYIQKRWKHLRNSFARELAKRKRPKSRSGSSWKTYVYFDQMSYLLPSTEHAEVECNLKVEEDGTDSEGTTETAPIEELPRPSVSITSTRKRKSPRTCADDGLAQVLPKSSKSTRTCADDGLAQVLAKSSKSTRTSADDGLAQVLAKSSNSTRTCADDGLAQVLAKSSKSTRTCADDGLAQVLAKSSKSTRTCADDGLAQVLAKSSKSRQEKGKSLHPDPDRLFLLSLLSDLKKVPNQNKAAVKIALITAINDGRYSQNSHHSLGFTTTTPETYPIQSSFYMYPDHSIPASLHSQSSSDPFGINVASSANSPSPGSEQSLESSDTSEADLY